MVLPWLTSILIEQLDLIKRNKIKLSMFPLSDKARVTSLVQTHLLIDKAVISSSAF